MQKVARLERVEVRTTEPYSQWQNKAESVINIIKVKSKIGRVQINIPKRVWDFVMVKETEKYSCTAGKDGRQDLE